MNRFLQVATAVGFVAASFTAIRGRFVLGAQVAGSSMAPVLRDRDVVLGVTWPRKFVCARGAIVLARVGSLHRRLVIKRVTGVAGDKRSWLPSQEPRPIPPGQVFLVGDAAVSGADEAATDSRTFGPVRASQILARVIVVHASQLTYDEDEMHLLGAARGRRIERSPLLRMASPKS